MDNVIHLCRGYAFTNLVIYDRTRRLGVSKRSRSSDTRTHDTIGSDTRRI